MGEHLLEEADDVPAYKICAPVRGSGRSMVAEIYGVWCRPEGEETTYLSQPFKYL